MSRCIYPLACANAGNPRLPPSWLRSFVWTTYRRWNYPVWIQVVLYWNHVHADRHTTCSKLYLIWRAILSNLDYLAHNCQSRRSHTFFAVKIMPKSWTRWSHSWPITHHLRFSLGPPRVEICLLFEKLVTQRIANGWQADAGVAKLCSQQWKNETGSKHHKTERITVCMRCRCVSDTCSEKADGRVNSFRLQRESIQYSFVHTGKP